MLIAGVLVLVLLGLGIWLLVKGISSQIEKSAQARAEQQAEEPAEAPAESTSQAPSPDASAASGRCPTEAVVVTGGTDKKEYGPDDSVTFRFTVTNDHENACLVAVGTKDQEYVVEHEGDTVWSSRWCADPEADGDNAEVEQVFAAGAEKSSSLPWNRIPIDSDCTRTGEEDFAAGDYELIVKLGEIESAPVAFTLRAPPGPEPTEETESAEDAETDGEG